MATIGRARAIAQIYRHRLKGRLAWWVWLLVHIYYLSGFRNRLSVLIQWAWSYFTFGRGARLIVPKEWRSYEARGKEGVGPLGAVRNEGSDSLSRPSSEQQNV